MIKRKKNSGKTRGLFSKKGQTSGRKKTGSAYNLELLESRVLLSGDLAGAVQVVPINPVQAPSQAVTLNVPAGSTAAQQTFSVAEMLAKPASSFSQFAGKSGQAITNAASHAPGLSTESEIQIISDQQSGVTSQPVTPIVQTEPTTSVDPTSVTTENTSSLVEPTPVLQTQSQPTPSTATAIQSDMATISPIVQSQPTLTVSSSVVSGDTSLPLLDPVSQIQDQPISQPIATTVSSVVAAPVTDTQPLLTSPIIAQPSQDQTISQSLITPVQTEPASQVESASTLPATEIVAQPVLSTTESSVEPTAVVSQPIVAIPTTTTTDPIKTLTNIGTATSTAINSQLPQATVDTSMPTTSVTVRVGPHGDYTDLQTALNNVSLGTTILLEPGVSYTSLNDTGFILPNKTTGTGWIVIRPDVPDSALPGPGTRATPADSAWMPKIVRGNGNLYAISSEAGAHNYRIIGVEVMNQGNVDTAYPGAAFVNLTSSQETSLAAQSHDILFDRVYIHGPSAGGSIGMKFGIVFGGQYEGVINSTIEDITYGSDAIAVGSWSGAGPFIIRNNTLSSTGENIMFGGADTQIAGLVPSDIEIRDNYIYKPLKWRDDPAYNSGSNKIVAKNLFEVKNAQRVLVDGNVFENMWPAAQPGFAMTFSPRQATAASNQPWTVVQDITVTNNIFRNTANGIAISGQDTGTPATLLGGRFLVKNNLFTNNGGYPGTGIIFQLGNGAFDVAIEHNTVIAPMNLAGIDLALTYGSANGDFTPMQRFVLKDNIFQAMNYPIVTGGSSLFAGIPGYVWVNNVFAGPWPTSSGWTAETLPQGNGNDYPATAADIGFVNLSGGDYRLATTSPYKGAASDGMDIGVNWDQFNAANS